MRVQGLVVQSASLQQGLSAVTAAVKDVRAVIERARDRLGVHGTGTILLLDEVHRFNKAQQDALLPAVEAGLIVLIGATTENPHFEVNPPLMSRSTLFRLNPLDSGSLVELVRRGLAAESATADEDAVEHLAARSAGDGRNALTGIEVAVALAGRRIEAAPLPGPVHLCLSSGPPPPDPPRSGLPVGTRTTPAPASWRTAAVADSAGFQTTQLLATGRALTRVTISLSSLMGERATLRCLRAGRCRRNAARGCC